MFSWFSSVVMPPVGVPPPPHILSTLPSHGGQEDPRTRSIVPHGIQEDVRTRSLSSPVRTFMGGADTGIDKELSVVMTGLTEFKAELLQLHVLVSGGCGCELWGGVSTVSGLLLAVVAFTSYWFMSLYH